MKVTESVNAAPREMVCVSIPCMICGTFTELTQREMERLDGNLPSAKICKECKAAVAYAKRMMKNSK